MFVATVGLSACGRFGGGAPSGQVVAKVNGEEITNVDVQTELNGFTTRDPALRKKAEQAALQQIIQRKVLAQAAKKEKVENTPEYARLKARADELLLVKTWQDSLAKAVPPPSLEEAQDYISKHPDSFGARKRFEYDDVRFVWPLDPALQAQLKPMTSLDEVKAALDARKIRYDTGTGEFDAMQIDPRMTEMLLRFKPTDMFQLTQGNLWTVGKVREVKVDPVTGNAAVSRAMDVLRAQRVQTAVGRRFGVALAQAKDKIKYGKGYEPPRAAPPAAAPAPAPAAPAPAGKGS